MKSRAALRKTSADERYVSAKVKEYYREYAKYEKERLRQDPYHSIEFTVTNHFLRKYLPRSGLILDAGGGSGTYTIELAKQGYDIVLVDLTPELLRIAKRRIKKANVESRVKQITEGSITDLSFSEEAFDAVLCLGGPLNHVLNEGHRGHAVAELVRVARRGSPVFISVISRLGLMRTILVETPDEIQDCKHHLESGDYIPHILPRRQVKGFTAAHWFLPEELRDLCENNGVEILEMAALEGLSSYNRKETNQLAKDTRKWRIWIEVLLRTCNQPSIIGSSEHFLLVGTKT
jgi:2-polyprenyl-3-methyl-5-hydroxy-6-metoxy-1,4-benzoquinol methylase